MSHIWMSHSTWHIPILGRSSAARPLSRSDASAFVTTAVSLLGHLFICVTWLIHVCGMTHSYVRHDSLVCVKWLVRMCNMPRSYVWAAHPLLRSDVVCICMYICVHNKRNQISLYMYQRSWLQLSADWPIYSCVWHDPSICETWLIHTCDMSHSWQQLSFALAHR